VLELFAKQGWNFRRRETYYTLLPVRLAGWADGLAGARKSTMHAASQTSPTVLSQPNRLLVVLLLVVI